jgi:hypothetical protein
MKEEKARDLLQKSINETSEDFTDKLMRRLEAEKVAKKNSTWNFTPTFSVLVLVILAISFTSYKFLKPGVNLFDMGLEIGRTPIFTIGTVLFFLALNHILKLNETYSLHKNNA